MKDIRITITIPAAETEKFKSNFPAIYPLPVDIIGNSMHIEKQCIEEWSTCGYQWESK